MKCEQVHTLDGDDRKNGAEDAQDQTCRPGVTMLELMSNVCVLEVLWRVVQDVRSDEEDWSQAADANKFGIL